MHLGFHAMNTPEDLPPDELGRALEDRGFESLWFGEHSHIPVQRSTSYPGGGEMPAQYARMMDPLIGLMAAAAATEQLRLGAGVLLPLERDLLTMAKATATLDRLAGGRLLVGLGAGWNREELANHTDVPWSERYDAVEEHAAALRILWTEPEPSYSGRYVDFAPLWSDPKPAQQPNPPLYLGLTGPRGQAVATRVADAWLPMVTPDGWRTTVEGFRALGGRASAMPVSVVYLGCPTLEELRGVAAIGVERVVLGLGRPGWKDPASVVPFLDRYAPIANELKSP